MNFELMLEKAALENTTVSLFSAAVNSKSCVCNIKFSEVIYKNIDRAFGYDLKSIGQYKFSENPEEVKLYKEIKGKLPCFLLTTNVPEGASSFEGKDVVNPYVIIDIDNLEASEENFSKINSLPFVVGSGISLSGKGFYSVVRFEKREKMVFSALFEQLAKEYLDNGIEIDKACKNINRLRVVSPYEFKWNDKFKEPFEYIEPVEEAKIIKPVVLGEIKEGTLTVQEKYKFYGKVGEKYHREFQISKYFTDGSHILYSYASTLRNLLGDKGWQVYRDYFPETSESILRSQWGRDYGVKGCIKKELLAQGIIEEEIILEKKEYVKEGKKNRSKDSKVSWGEEI